MMTIREVFETVKAHLLNQMRQAKDPGEGCAYRVTFRDDDGDEIETLRCAVGCLIKDEYYDPRFEGLGIERCPPSRSEDHQTLVGALRSSGVPTTPTAISILTMLQSVHDNYSPVNWASELTLVEKRVELYEKKEEK